MEKFWREFSKVNAALFMMLALLLLLGALAWFLRPHSEGLIKVGLKSENRASNGKPAHAPERGANLDLQDSISIEDIENPFRSRYLQRVIAERERKARLAREREKKQKQSKTAKDDKVGGKESKADAASKGSQGGTQSQKDKAPEPPREMLLIYRGMMTRIDGTRLALVERLDNETSTYYEEGDSMEWTRISGFDSRSLELAVQGSDTSYVLQRGVEKKIAEKKRR